MIRSRSIHVAVTALSTIALAGAVEAQGLLSSQGTIVATDSPRTAAPALTLVVR